jgi:quercetin dioxygenase-like cupin family protein
MKAMISPKDATSFRWQDLPQDQPLALLDRRRFIGERIMLAEVRLREGCRVPTHAHENEQFACVLSGRLRFGIGAEGSDAHYETILGAGQVMHLPSNVPHSAEALEESVVLDIFSPPSERTGVDRS